MLMGPCAGEKVCDAKVKVRQELIDRGEAMPYFEPESLVLSRCVCVGCASPPQLQPICEGFGACVRWQTAQAAIVGDCSIVGNQSE